MSTITLEGLSDIAGRWGVAAGEYAVWGANGAELEDFQDLMVSVSKYRAISIEGEVEPLAERIRRRNARLEELGNALAEFTKIQTSFSSDAKGSTACGVDVAFSEAAASVLRDLGYANDGGWAKVSGKYIINKQTCDGVLSRIKSEIDALNNIAQADMTRLQSLVERRDESYSAATNLMTSISETRSNAIKNF